MQINITDYGDSANGSATALPYPRIQVFAAPPALDGNLGNYDDWLRLLIFHEYAHILQLDMVSGFPALINLLLGRHLAPNHALPSFVLEGGAVWAESLTSGRGRIHSAPFRAFLRIQALEGRLYGIDAVTHSPQDWPGANVWYLYGGHFIHWLVKTRGAQVLPRIHRAMSDELIPFSMNQAALEASGQWMTQLFKAWQADLLLRSQAELERLSAEGLSLPTPLTSEGTHHRCPRFDAQGRLLAFKNAGRRPAGIYRFGEGPPELLFKADGLERFDPCGSGYLLSRAVQHQGPYIFHDLFLWEPGRGQRRLTQGARLSEPSCSLDARWAVATQIYRGRSRLMRVDLADGRLSLLYDPGGLNQVGLPVVAPDGGVVFSRVSQSEGRDLLHRSPEGKIRCLSRDGALELYPRFSPDGRWLIYASDLDGIFNLYARAWPDGAPRRLTRMLTGALDPELRGGRLIFKQILSDGYDLAELPFKPGSPALPGPRESSQRAEAEESPLPERSYAPLETLTPIAWRPAFSFSSAEESLNQLGLELETSDASNHHLLRSSLDTIPEEEALALRLSYTYNGWIPSWSSEFAHSTRSRANAALYGLELRPWREEISSFSTGSNLALAKGQHRGSFGFRYGFAQVRPLDNPEPSYDPMDPSPLIPRGLRMASLSLSAQYQNAEAFPLAISLESGRRLSVNLRLRHPKLGGELENAEIFVEHVEYLSLWRRHVLSLRLNGAMGRGEIGQRIFYALGGVPARNLLLDALDDVYPNSKLLRGYPISSISGDRFLLGTLEYRVPLLDIFGGPSSAPLFFRRLKLALFSDWGQADSAPLKAELSAFKKGIGLELLSEVTLGWRKVINARIGYAGGLDEGGEGQLYFFLGRWY